MTRHALQLGASLLLGAIAGALLVFLFPRGALSTLVHELLHLPGPGAGVALVVGPLAVLVCHSSRLATGVRGTAIVSCLAFAATSSLLAALLAEGGMSKSTMGSAWFLLVTLPVGVVLDVCSIFAGKRAPWLVAALSGAVSNLVLLAVCWLAVFPRTASVVSWQAALVIGAIGIGAGAAAGIAAIPISRSLSRLVSKREEKK